MKKLLDYISSVAQENSGPQEGHYFDLVLNEEYSIQTDIVAVEGNDIYIGLDQQAYALLENAGLLELADDPGYQGSTGTALGGKPATPAAAAAQPAPSGARVPAAGAKPMQSAAGLKSAQQKAAAAGSPAPTPVGTKVYPATDAMTLKMAQQTSGRAGTSTAPKTPIQPRQPIQNPNQAAVDAANATQRGQMDKLAGNTPAAAPDIEGMKQGIAGGSPAAQAAQATEPTPAPQPNALGVMPQANVPGSPTATAEPAAPATEPSSSPQTNALGIAAQANVPGSPTATSAPTPTATPNAVKSGSGQEVKTGTGGTLTTRTPDQIAADNKNPYARYANPVREEFDRMLELAGVKRD